MTESIHIGRYQRPTIHLLEAESLEGITDLALDSIATLAKGSTVCVEANKDNLYQVLPKVNQLYQRLYSIKPEERYAWPIRRELRPIMFLLSPDYGLSGQEKEDIENNGGMVWVVTEDYRKQDSLEAK